MCRIKNHKNRIFEEGRSENRLHNLFVQPPLLARSFDFMAIYKQYEYVSLIQETFTKNLR